MFKVLLVDDEILTREAISTNVRWEEQGFYLIGAAENGQDAINQIEKEQPDLVITDICMPYMDGLELSSYIYQNYPQTKVVILSGYDEFEYARLALEYRVKEYVLKPVTSLELKEVLKKVKVSLEEDVKQRAQIEKIQMEYNKNIPVLRERFLRKLIEEKYFKKDVYEQMKKLQINFYGEYYTVVLIDLEDATQFCIKFQNHEETLIYFSIYNIANEIMEEAKCGFVVQLSENRLALLFAAGGEEKLEYIVKSNCDRILKALWNYLSLKASVMIGTFVHAPCGWKDSYSIAKKALDYKFFLEPQEYFFGEDVLNLEFNIGQIAVNQWSNQFLLLIKLNKKSQLIEAIQQLFEEFRSKCSLKKDILLYVQNIYLSIVRAFEEAEELIDKDHSLEGILLKTLEDCKYLKDLKEAFCNLCIDLMNKISWQRDGEGRKQAVLAMDYIKNNYMDPNLSLNMLCSHLGVSISYFSSIFKNYTGETFVEALTRIRIEKSKKFMDTTDLRTYEIADKVGYNDPHYFSLIFKKVTGMTPSEYAKGVR